jgi:hypothetical protein
VSDGFVFVGPGTYHENVVIDKDDFTLQGAGYNTLIDGGVVDTALQIRSANSTIKSLRIVTDGDYNTFDADSSSDNLLVTDCVIDNTGGDAGVAADISGDDSIVRNSEVIHGRSSLAFRGLRNIGTNNYIHDSSPYHGYNVNGDDSIVVNSIIEDSIDMSVSVIGNDVLVGGNRISGPDRGIRTTGADTLIFNNRISVTNQSIQTDGTGAVTDGNLTGGAN